MNRQSLTQGVFFHRLSFQTYEWDHRTGRECHQRLSLVLLTCKHLVPSLFYCGIKTEIDWLTHNCGDIFNQFHQFRSANRPLINEMLAENLEVRNIGITYKKNITSFLSLLLSGYIILAVIGLCGGIGTVLTTRSFMGSERGSIINIVCVCFN